jgi:hypothetical protein
MFFSYLGLTEGKSISDIQTKIKNDLPTAVMGSWTVWVSPVPALPTIPSRTRTGRTFPAWYSREQID